LLLAANVAALAVSCNTVADEWPWYGRDPAGTRYSALTQITPNNVRQLRPAWTFHTGDVSGGSSVGTRGGFETTPLVIDGRLYLTRGMTGH
jgi:quinoprotein glucose dehydrogenase